MVAAAGANAIGLNFFRDSPRYVTIADALVIAHTLPPYVDPVGLFVNATPAVIRETALSIGIRTVQLHGEHTPELVQDLKDLNVVPAFSLKDEASVAAVIRFVSECRQLGRLPSAILVDANVPDKFGGTGQPAPWNFARAVVARCSVPVTLAGGLNPKNVADAIRAVRPWGVDVASGVEVAPGRKEQFKVRQFVDAAVRAWRNK